jgi:hypothetical protein
MTTTTDLAAFRPGGQVRVSVRCTATLSSVAMRGLPQTVTLTATSISPLDTYREYADSQ